jgi:hypothetical protein
VWFHDPRQLDVAAAVAEIEKIDGAHALAFSKTQGTMNASCELELRNPVSLASQAIIL